MGTDGSVAARAIDLTGALGDGPTSAGNDLAESAAGAVWTSRPYDPCRSDLGETVRVAPDGTLGRYPGTAALKPGNGRVLVDGPGRIWLPFASTLPPPVIPTTSQGCGPGEGAESAWFLPDGTQQTKTADGREPGCFSSFWAATVTTDGAFWCAGASSLWRVENGVTRQFPGPSDWNVQSLTTGPGGAVIARVTTAGDLNNAQPTRTFAIAPTGAITAYPELDAIGMEPPAVAGTAPQSRRLVVSPDGTYWFGTGGGIGGRYSAGLTAVGRLPQGTPAGQITPSPRDPGGAADPIPPRVALLRLGPVASRRAVLRKGRTITVTATTTRPARVFLRATIRARDAKRLGFVRRARSIRVATLRTSIAGRRILRLRLTKRTARRLTRSKRPLRIAIRGTITEGGDGRTVIRSLYLRR